MPLGGAGQLLRYRLIERLATRWDQCVLTLRGGPGCGKTTALAQAVRHHALEPRGVEVWHTCGPADLDPARFASRLLERLGAAIGTDPLESILTAIIDLAPLDVCLILDDVHELGARTSSGELLARLIRRLPSTAHVVLSGRALPEVPLARLRLAGRVADVNERELSFTAAEVRTLAAGLGRATPVDSVFGGWPALVRLALSARPEAAIEFLREELLGDLAAGDRCVLLALAQLGTATADEVAQVLHRPVDLIGLVSRLPLIEVLGDERVRCHDLWRDVLDRHLLPEAVALRRRSVRVLLDAGRVEEAGSCAIAGRDWDMLASAARELVIRTISVLPVELGARWLAVLPATHRDTPEATLLRAAVLQTRDVEDSRVDRWLDQAGAGFVLRADVPAAAAALALGVLAAQARADLPRLIELTQRAAALPGADDHPILQVLRCGSQAVLAELHGDPEAAVHAYENAPIDAVAPALSLSMHRFWVHCLLMAGRGDDAVRHAARYLDAGGSPHSRRCSAVARWSAGDPIDYHDLLAALEHPPQAVSAAAAPEAAGSQSNPSSRPSTRDAFVDQCFSAQVHSSGGIISSHPPPDPQRLHNGRDAAVATSAAAAQAITAGDEAVAGALLRRQLQRFPLAEHPLAERHLRRSLALGYVLEPRLRELWDVVELGPTHRRMRDLARAFLAARLGNPVDLRLDPGFTFCALPLPWSVELACRLVDIAHPDGTELARWLCDAIGPGVLEQLRRVETRPPTMKAGPIGQSVRTPDPLNSAHRAAAGAGAVLRTLPIRPATILRIRVLGPLDLQSGPEPPGPPRRARVRQLLAALLLHRSITREQLIDLLWPDFEPDAAQRNLRVTLTHLRRVLDPGRARAQAGYNLRIIGEQVSIFDSDALNVDLWDFERWVDDAALAQRQADTDRQATQLERAVRLWRGPPMDDLRSIADLQPLVQRIRIRYLEALLRLGELRLVQGHWSEAQTWAARAVTEAPFDERAHRLALAAALQHGDPTAIRCAAARVLRSLQELGVPAEPTTQALLSRARQHLGLPNRGKATSIRSSALLAPALPVSHGYLAARGDGRRSFRPAED